MIIRMIYTFLLVVLFSACSSSRQGEVVEEKEDKAAKATLQGLWLDDVTSEAVFQITGDTLYHQDASIAPVAFKIIKDSLKTYGSLTTSYHIKKQGEYTLWIQSMMGDILHLRKAENQMDSLSYIPEENINPEPTTDEVIKKDRIVHYNNVRYRGYVYINPTQIKVIQSGLSEEGLGVDNVYYDNIIHICVYEGKKELFARDIKKQDFDGIVPNDFFQQAILSDMDFIGVNAHGYHYQATICIPNGVSCYMVNLFISSKGEITYELVD